MVVCFVFSLCLPTCDDIGDGQVCLGVLFSIVPYILIFNEYPQYSRRSTLIRLRIYHILLFRA